MHRLPPLFLFLVLTCCATPAEDRRQKAESEIRDADLAMSEQAAVDGFHKTLLAWADTNVVKFEEGRLPILGKAALAGFWNDQPDTRGISWKPFKVEAAASGELGYSLGYWRFVTPDTTVYGNYYTFWKKQQDGRWKFVLDGGNGTPEPPEPW